MYSYFTLDCIVGILIIIVTAKEIAKKLNKAGASCTGDMATGTWKSIEKDMEPCLGKRWLTR